MRWLLPASVFFLAIAALVLVVFNPLKSRQDATEEIRRRIARLQDRVGKARREIPTYSPKVPGRIADLAQPAKGILRQLPGVVETEVAVEVKHPTHRIVQLRDWHYVPKELFAFDMRQTYKRSLSQEEIDLLYQEFLLEVEFVHLEQLALLRCLVKHHGLREVFSEGLTREGQKPFQGRIDAHMAIEKDLHKQLADVDGVMRTATGERLQKAQAIETEIADLVDKHRLESLDLGSPAWLLIDGEIKAVIPLDDAALLENANPISPDGHLNLDPTRLQARRDAQVRTALEHGPFAFIVLGGAHDLSDNVRRLGSGKCEYIRVTTRDYRQIAGEEK